MKILFVTESWPPAMNGVATSSVRLVNELRARGHETRVIAPAVDPAPGEGVHRARSLRVGPTQEYTVGRLGARCVRMVEQWQPDLMHVASPLSVGYSGLRAAYRHAIPTIAAYMTDFTAFAGQALARFPGHDAAGRLFGRVQKGLHSMATVNVACSQYALDTLRSWQSPAPREWLRAIDTTRFTPTRRVDRLATGHRNMRVIGYAGRLAGEKELDLIASLKGIEGTRLKIIGDGPMRARLERLMPDAEFTGKLEGVAYPHAVSSLDLFVHPGRGETLSQVVLEALSSGVPCIVPSRGSGSTELVAPGISGRHFDGGSGESLRCAAIAELNEPDRDPWRIAATVGNRTWTASMDSLLSSYDAALNTR